jgi:hypothetical protein
MWLLQMRYHASNIADAAFTLATGMANQFRLGENSMCQAEPKG